jgi:hypothetical protein
VVPVATVFALQSAVLAEPAPAGGSGRSGGAGAAASKAPGAMPNKDPGPQARRQPPRKDEPGRVPPRHGVRSKAGGEPAPVGLCDGS